MDTNEIERFAHLAAHETAVIATKLHVEVKGRYADNETIEEIYKTLYNKIFAFIEKKLK